jgi:site-specific DNA-cytosine methylase
MKIENEVWMPIPGYEGIYEVSNFGRVKRLPLGKQWHYRQTHNNIRKQKVGRNGYCCVNLSKDNAVKWYSVHRLVAMAFIPNPSNYPCVNHRDENKQNNCVENLEWCSYQYNANYGTGTKRQQESKMKNPNLFASYPLIGAKNSKQVVARLKDGTFVGEYDSVKAAAQALNVSTSTITRQFSGASNREKSRKYVFESKGYNDEIKRRKMLTPRECFRLMDVEDADIDKIQASGVSKSQQYKMAGNSICVGVLYEIFRSAFVQPEKVSEPLQMELF